jgi:amidohydrolase
MSPIERRIIELSDKHFPEMVRLRRTIHEHPELAFEEIKTSALVGDTLEKIGLDVRRGVAKTGVIGTLRGNQNGKTVALRSDMDALPIPEATGLPFASKNPGRMHAC